MVSQHPKKRWAFGLGGSCGDVFHDLLTDVFVDRHPCSQVCTGNRSPRVADHRKDEGIRRPQRLAVVDQHRVVGHTALGIRPRSPTRQESKHERAETEPDTKKSRFKRVEHAHVMSDTY